MFQGLYNITYHHTYLYDVLFDAHKYCKERCEDHKIHPIKPVINPKSLESNLYYWVIKASNQSRWCLLGSDFPCFVHSSRQWHCPLCCPRDDKQVSIISEEICASRHPNSDVCFVGHLHHMEHFPLQWRYNERDGVSNHQMHDCLLNYLFRRRSKKTSKPRNAFLALINLPTRIIATSSSVTLIDSVFTHNFDM